MSILKKMLRIYEEHAVECAKENKPSVSMLVDLAWGVVLTALALSAAIGIHVLLRFVKDEPLLYYPVRGFDIGITWMIVGFVAIRAAGIFCEELLSLYKNVAVKYLTTRADIRAIRKGLEEKVALPPEGVPSAPPTRDKSETRKVG